MARPQSKTTDASKNSAADARKAPVRQTDVPSCTLEQALRVPRAILDNYAGAATAPLYVAQALNMAPNSGTFRAHCGAAIAYGLTTGGWNASEISVQGLAQRILAPTAEGDDECARREATLRPRILREFLEKYAGMKVPREDIAQNVLVDMGVPRESAEKVFSMILDSAKSVGLLEDIKGVLYVGSLDQLPSSRVNRDLPNAEEQSEDPSTANQIVEPKSPPSVELAGDTKAAGANKRVFVTHGKNRAFVEPIKQLLAFGELEPVVAVDRESVSQPVPDKVMEGMRACSAAIIHVDAEMKLMDAEGETHVVLNPNVLIEIGAAMALYGRRYILLVKDGIDLPSNLQGLYEVRYSGDTLDGDATIRLMKAINDIKGRPIPDRTKVNIATTTS